MCNDKIIIVSIFTVPIGTVPEKGLLYQHGNAKKSGPYIRTAPSVLREAAETYKDPSIHYKEKVACSGVPFTHEATLKPRNPRQVTNAQAQVHKSRKYTQDDLFNLVELTVDLKDYIHRMNDVPQRFVQIVFDQSRKHWVCVSNMFSEEVVEIFDSGPPKKFTISNSIRRQLAVIMNTQKDSFEVRSVKDLM